MIRKISTIGGYSYVVTLPKEWVEKRCKSQYLELQEKEEILILKPVQQVQKEITGKGDGEDGENNNTKISK